MSERKLKAVRVTISPFWNRDMDMQHLQVTVEMSGGQKTELSEVITNDDFMSLWERVVERMMDRLKTAITEVET